MKNVLMGIVLAIFNISALSAQWTTSGTNIYNSNSGNVGIGVTSPAFTLDITNNSSADDNTLQLTHNSIYNNWLYLSNNINTGASGLRFINNQGIGMQMFMGGTTNAFFPNEFGFDEVAGNIAFSSRLGVIDFRTVGPFSANSVMRILNNGNVGIGTTTPGAKLDINGTAYSRKVFIGTPDANTLTNIGTNLLAVNGTAVFVKAKVALYGPTTWPDYVFAPNYKLTPLDSLEQFIQVNRHLPEVPSADDVKKDGIDLGDNQVLLLKKIEELTLVVIQQNKELEELKTEMIKTKENVKKLQSGLKN